MQRALADGAQVLAVARQGGDLAALAKSAPGIETLALNAATEAAPPKVFRKRKPDLLVICGGATPPVRPMPELTWAEFSVNWEVDAKMAFLFCREALQAPLAAGSVAAIISSGAGIGGSPISAVMPAPNACRCSSPSTVRLNPIAASSASASWRSCPPASCRRLTSGGPQ